MKLVKSIFQFWALEGAEIAPLMHVALCNSISCNILLQTRRDYVTSLKFHWLQSGYMQLVSGFMQLAVSGRRRYKVHFNCLFEGKMLIVH